MKLLSIPHSRPEFFELQQGVDSVETALQVVNSLSQDVGAAKSRLNSMTNPPSNDRDNWQQKKIQRQIELRFQVGALEEALDALKECNQALSVTVQKAREVADAIKHQPDFFRNAALNVLICDALRSSTTALIAEERRKLFDLEGDRYFWTMQSLHEEFAGNRRDFTARYTNNAGQWQYIQRDCSGESSPNVPAVPCLTQREARRVAEYLTMQLLAYGPDSPIKVEVYEITGGSSYRV